MLTLSVVRGAKPPDATNRREVSVWRDTSGRVRARLFVAGQTRWIDWPELGLFVFRRDQRDVRVWPSPGVAAADLYDLFTRRLQPVILQAMGQQALHASASLSDRGVVAFCGRSGSGKSTLAFALRRSGWPQIADDALAIVIAGEEVLAHPLPFQIDLRPEAQAHFDAGGISGSIDFEPRPHRLHTVVLLRQDWSAPQPAVRPVLGPERFHLLLTHAHAFDPDSEAEELARAYLEIAASVPIVELSYRPDFDQLADLASTVIHLVHGAAQRDATARATGGEP